MSRQRPRHRGSRRRTGRSREELLAAAVWCIAELGFERTRLRDVAARAGASIGLIQHHFESRDELLAEAFRWSCDELIERWRGQTRSVAGSPWDQVRLLLEALTLDPSLRRHATTWTEFCVSSARHPELRGAVVEVFAAWRQLIVHTVEEGAALGQLRPELPADEVADILNALVDGFEMATAVDAGLVEPERFHRLALAVAARLLHPVGGAVGEEPDGSEGGD